MSGHEELLKAIRDALDVPYGATLDGRVTRGDILAARAGVVQVAIDGVMDYGYPAEQQADWLRRYVAEHEPVPDDYVSHVAEIEAERDGWTVYSTCGEQREDPECELEVKTLPGGTVLVKNADGAS